MGLFNSNAKKPYIFYLDKDEKYQYLIKESFKSTHQLKLLSSEDAIIYELKNVTSKIDAIIISIDEFNFHRIINEFYLIKNSLPNIIFMTNKYDSLVMQSFMVSYCASNYLIKPFTKSGVTECIKNLSTDINFSSKTLIDLDKKLFDEYYDYLVTNNLNKKEINRIEIEPIDKQLKKLEYIINEDTVDNIDEQNNNVNIVFLDDKKQSLSFYKQFVNEQKFSSYFTSCFETVQEIDDEKGIDIILIEIKELDDMKIQRLQQLLKSSNKPDVLAISSINIDEREINVMNAGVRLLLQKPLTNKKLVQLLNQVIEYRKIRQTIKHKLNKY